MGEWKSQWMEPDVDVQYAVLQERPGGSKSQSPNMRAICRAASGACQLARDANAVVIIISAAIVAVSTLLA